ncbi:hypothetical protein QUW47_02060 [Phocaeicola barnesiae]|uniref:hypothetical protein n=1 Tax=Phocaeicola barnesiae TaxID=376804 RepID=UPI0025A40FAB|nr:hypothetical protein [Phocaeicola barnesiae]MDM8240690.1 hypothetical protein [Phocaeicola barnesiae]
MELKIYNKSGNLILTASPNTSSSLTEEIGGECSVSASFTHTSFILLDVDSYIEIEGVRYKVKSRYRPKQKDTQTYEYSVKFYAPIHDAEDTLMLFQEGGTTSEFSYDGGPREHLQLWIDNMNRRAGGNLWSIGTVIIAENKVIDYRNVKCWDAAFGSNGIAATFETEMWADGYVINLCKAERGEIVELGYLQGLTNLAQEDNGEVKFFTRLFPLGSTKNIDASKYGYSRLQLPSRAKYVDKNVSLYGVKEEYEESSFSGIYPKYEGTVSSVRTENKTNEEGRDYTVYYFKDSGMNFNPDDYAIPEYTYKLEFQSGELAGRGTEGSFEAAWHNDTKEWEIVNVYPDDTTQIPGGAIIPKSGDKYIPWNFTLPQEYITAAEQAYKQAVDNYLDSYSFDPNKYTGTTDRNFVERNNTPLKIGWNVRLLSEQYFTGGYKDTRITKVVRKLNDLCQATITCTDQVGTTWKTSVNNQLNNLQYILTKQEQQAIIDIIKTTDSKTASDYNVFSALRSLATFLRKDIPDSTKHLLSLFGGAIFGEKGFAEGLLGFGAKIDSKGYGEMRRLKVWEELVVPLLVYNRVDVVIGDKWRSPGAGIIETVTPDTDQEGNTLSTGTATLKLEDGEIGAIAVDDMAMGIWHFGNGSDATEDSDDSKGNFTFAGFTTAYWRIIEVTGDDNKTFRYALRPGYTTHPQPQMTFSCRGNFTNEDRQKSVYETRTYTRMLHHQNEWEITASNIAMQYGDLSNLNVFGMNMEGYSTYLNSVYFTGTITQMKPDGTPIRTANDRGEWLNNTKYDYYDRVSHNGCIWLCVDEDGTDTEPTENNPSWLLQVSKGEAGQDGTSFKILGSKNDESELPQEGNQVGDAYLINGDMWVWTEEGVWKNVGNIQGPAGESVQNMGGWYSGLFVPYLGVVRMGKGSFMCVAKNGTYNPPYYTLLDNSGNRIKTNDGYILTGEINNAEYQLIAADGTDGQNGMDGVPGKDGVDGKTYYTWIRYADDAEGNGISNDPTGKSFIGFAYNKETPLESNTPSDYMWSDIKGEQGVPGAVGADGKTYYTWIAYSDYPDGNPMYQQPNENTKYIGIAVNKETSVEGTDPSEYTWSKFKGEDGKDGLNGADGVDGKDGTSIIWKGEFASAPSNPQNGWAYKNTSDKKSYVYQDGAWYQMTIDGVDGQNGKDGISIVWKGDLSTPPSNPQTNWAYRDTDNGRVYIYNGSSWELMVVDGTDGVDGAKGEDGFSVYITYNDSETEPSKPTGNGTTGGWHTEATSTAIWMSQKVAASSTEGTWGNPIKIKGETGSQGEKGDGFSLMGQWYDGMLVPYMGVVIMGGNSFAAKVATTNPPMWTLKDNNGNRIKSEKGYILTGEYNTEEYDIIAEKGQDGIDGLQGADGKDGIPGKDGVDGKTSYFHIKYSENENGYPMTETPSTYIGTYVDFEEKDSDDYTKYAWARFEGIQGEKGEQGIPGYNGVDGKTYYLHIKYSNDGGSTFTGNNGETPGDYIGVYTDTNPNDSNDTSDYTWSKTKGDKGDGYTQLGAWYTGLLVPKMGVVTMGGSSFVAKVATYNPPMWTLLDSAGNRIKTSTGYILTGGINTAEYTVLAEKGDKGDKGETGDKGDKGDKGDTGAQGKQGIDGCVIRDSEWTTGVEYRNDSNVTDGSLAVRYIDVVLVRNNATTTGWDAYRCKITHVSSSSITYTNTSYWEKFGTNVGAIFTSLIIAKNAKITFLQGNQLLIQEDDGTITAGASGSNYGDAIRFWAGSQNPDDAPFRVNKKGKLFASGAEIEGDVTANRIYTPFKEVSLPYTWYGSSSPSNMSVRGRTEKTNVISLDQPSKYNGVTIQIYCVLESRSDAPAYVASMTPLFKFGMTEYLYYKLPTDKITRITSVLHPGGTYRWVIQDPETDNFMLSI